MIGYLAEGYGKLTKTVKLPARRLSQVSGFVLLTLTTQEAFSILSNCHDSPDTKTRVFLSGNATVWVAGVVRTRVNLRDSTLVECAMQQQGRGRRFPHT